jgi:hypothetical protein
MCLVLGMHGRGEKQGQWLIDGFLLQVGYGSAQSPNSSSVQWRVPLAVQTLPCLLLAIGMPFFPESPRHLIATDRADEGLQVLRRLHYDGTNEDWINTEFNEIKMTIEAEKAVTAPGWLVMFQVPEWRNRLFQGCMVQAFTQVRKDRCFRRFQRLGRD